MLRILSGAESDIQSLLVSPLLSPAAIAACFQARGEVGTCLDLPRGRRPLGSSQ